MTPDWALVRLTLALVVLTLGYVVATILIWIANNRMAEATRKQVDELQRQFHEQNRPYVCVRFESVRGALVCLSVENTGSSPARDVRVSVNEEFTNGVLDNNLAEDLRHFTQSVMYLSPRQKLYCCVGGPEAFSALKDVPLLVDVTYNGGKDTYQDHMEINVGSYGWALLYHSPLDDMSSYVKKMSEDLAKIESKLA